MITFAGPITANLFSLTGSGALTNSAPCFLHDTPIRTDHGDVAVRDLRIGDHVITLDSSAQPIKWIGRRSYASAFVAGNDDVIPIEIQAGAIADNVPDRNLIVFPRHAMFMPPARRRKRIWTVTTAACSTMPENMPRCIPTP
jgi:Hint domain